MVYRPDYFLEATFFPESDTGTIQCGNNISWNFGKNRRYAGGRMFTISSNGGGSKVAKIQEEPYINLYKDSAKVGVYPGYYWGFYYSGVPLHIMKSLYMLNNTLNVFDMDRTRDQYINIVVSSVTNISHDEIMNAASCLQKEKATIENLFSKKFGWLVVIDPENITFNMADGSKNPKLRFTCDNEYNSLTLEGQELDTGHKTWGYGSIYLKLDGTFRMNNPDYSFVHKEETEKLLTCHTHSGISLKQYKENMSKNIFPLQ